MNPTAMPDQRALDAAQGVSVARERMWGLIGGGLGALVGVGSALIAVYVEGANWGSSSSPWPEFFTHPRLLVYDGFLLATVAVGAALTVIAAIAARLSRFPRSDAFGAALGGAILTLLGGVLLFTRIVAIGSAR
jgi:hypothetical protein